MVDEDHNGWRVTEILIETPSQFVGNAPHDMIGKGRVVVDSGNLIFALRHVGLFGAAFREARTYPVSEITGWHVESNRIESTVGSIAFTDAPSPFGGPIASNGAALPLHILHITLSTHAEACALTQAAIAAGLSRQRASGSFQPHGSQEEPS